MSACDKIKAQIRLHHVAIAASVARAAVLITTPVEHAAHIGECATLGAAHAAAIAAASPIADHWHGALAAAAPARVATHSARHATAGATAGATASAASPHVPRRMRSRRISLW